MQKVAKVGGGDFDLIKTGAATWQFKWYTGQRGTDRTATVIFSLPLGNMANPRYVDDRIDEASVAVVGGAGEWSARYYTIVEGSDYHATTNNVEVFVNASNTVTADGRTAAGNEALDDLRRKRDMSFKVEQTPACHYLVHYVLGDKVTGYYTASATFKVARVDVELAETGEAKFDIGMEYMA